MKPLSETYKELGIAFTFPVEIKNSKGRRTYYEGSDGRWFKKEYDSKGNLTYYEDSDGYWYRKEYDSKGNLTYYENSKGYWNKREYDDDGNETYYENSKGHKTGTPRSKSCAGKVVEIGGIKYELKAL